MPDGNQWGRSKTRKAQRCALSELMDSSDRRADQDNLDLTALLLLCMTRAQHLSTLTIGYISRGAMVALPNSKCTRVSPFVCVGITTPGTGRHEITGHFSSSRFSMNTASKPLEQNTAKTSSTECAIGLPIILKLVLSNSGMPVSSRNCSIS